MTMNDRTKGANYVDYYCNIVSIIKRSACACACAWFKDR
jgi:hypothetical protein